MSNRSKREHGSGVLSATKSDLQAGWLEWQNKEALRGMTYKMIPLLGVLFLFMYTDIALLDNYTVSLIRLIPITLAGSLLLFHLGTPAYQTQKRYLYHILLVSLLIMMFARVILLDDDPNLGGSLAGLLLVVLVLSLELRTNMATAIGIYLIPTVLFTIFVFYPKNVWDISYFNIYPMMIAGLLFNIIHRRYNYRTFESKHLLAIEKQRAEALYRETREQNEAVNRAYQKLRDSEQSLKETLRARDKLISVIAHDIRNPFQAIIGYSDIINSDAQNLNREEIADYAQMIYKSGHNTLALIDNLLNWVRGQAGDIAVELRPHSLTKILSEIVDIMSVQAKSKKIQIDIRVPQDLTIEADYDTISTVFRNLLSNAVKFTPSGGEITMSSEKAHDREGKLTSISVSIKDSGKGFAGDSLDDLIVNGSVISRQGTEKERGTGLGLLICRDFVERNNGTLTARNIPGEGSEFTVTLPVRTE
ncbi:HAMP domain-containing sensor histidine kinase [Balneolales bacterium ANBcel1]|nr:HAMP domain-containing sensor histidine kinase [Balneolales bacterium ANBcel1]